MSTDPKDPNEVLTPAEAALLLKLPQKTIVQLCREGRIPTATKIGRQWRMLRRGLDGLFEGDMAQRSYEAPVRPATSVRSVAPRGPSRAEILRRLSVKPRQ